MNAAATLPDGDRLLRINTVAGLLSVSEKTVRRLIIDGSLQSIKIRGLRLVRASALTAMLNAARS